jgi:prepilin-type processing-associated H-X9-DG protein
MRHLEGFNAAFFDGHVKWYPRSKLYEKWDGTPVAANTTYVYDSRSIATNGKPSSMTAFYSPGCLWWTGL